jgi:hypothetical protein
VLVWCDLKTRPLAFRPPRPDFGPKFHVLLTSYETVLKDTAAFRGFKFEVRGRMPVETLRKCECLRVSVFVRAYVWCVCGKEVYMRVGGWVRP